MFNSQKRSLKFSLLLAACVTLGVSCDQAQQAPAQAVQPRAQPVAKEQPSKQAAPKIEKEESWQVIYIGENRVGYVHSRVEPISRDGQTFEKTSTDTHMTIERFGQKLNMQILLENVANTEGELVSFTQETRNPPADSTRVAGEVQGDKLILTTTIADKTTRQERAWEKGVKSPAYEARLLAENRLKPGESRSFDVFLPELKQKATVTMKAGKMETVKLFGDESRKLLRINTTNTILPTATRSWVDEKGNTLKSETDLLGFVMTTYEVTGEEAVKAIAGGDLDIAIGSLIQVKRIPKGHRARKVVYRITTPGDDPAEYFVADATQSVKRVADDTIDLTVAPPTIPATSKSAEAKPEFLASTTFLQSTDRRVVEHADNAVGDETDPAKMAKQMEAYVSKRLTGKNFSTAMASAAEVAAKLEGDCTEHAVLLAAMLRAKKIPSRIAVGLVYIEKSHKFGGHMWSEVKLGDQWVPLDATLGRGGIGAAHIKMANSSFADDGPAPVLSFLPMMKVLGTMKIKVIESE